MEQDKGELEVGGGEAVLNKVIRVSQENEI